jgi:DNA-binding CsgD family transcriptional regulator
VRTHLNRIYQRLDVTSRTAAVQALVGQERSAE